MNADRRTERTEYREREREKVNSRERKQRLLVQRSGRERKRG